MSIRTIPLRIRIAYLFRHMTVESTFATRDAIVSDGDVDFNNLIWRTLSHSHFYGSTATPRTSNHTIALSAHALRKEWWED